MRIALFVTCLADTLFPAVGRATVRLLERLGHRVEFPQAQTCCGQMHINTGYVRDALPREALHALADPGATYGAVGLLVLAIGLGLAHDLTAASKLQDCLMSGRTNCAVIPAQ